MAAFEQIINTDTMESAVSLFGSFDVHVKQVEKAFGVSVISRGTQIKVTGEPEKVYDAVRAVEGLLTLINKGEALKRLCAALGIAPEDTLAFGDGTNDLTMIRAAGCGVAMGNADFAVKAAADTVCDDNEHDGLAEYLERLMEEEA